MYRGRRGRKSWRGRKPRYRPSTIRPYSRRHIAGRQMLTYLKRRQLARRPYAVGYTKLPKHLRSYIARYLK